MTLNQDSFEFSSVQYKSSPIVDFSRFKVYRFNKTDIFKVIPQNILESLIYVINYDMSKSRSYYRKEEINGLHGRNISNNG